MPKRKNYDCLFLTPEGADQIPNISDNGFVLECIIKPVLSTYPHLNLIERGWSHAGRAGTDDYILLLQSSYIVFANISFKALNIFYEIGIRHAVQRPIIHFAKDKSERLIFPSFPVPSILYADDIIEENKHSLSNLISEIDSGNFAPVFPIKRIRNSKRHSNFLSDYTDFIIIGNARDLSDRINQVADNIERLCLNSLDARDQLIDLRDIANRLNDLTNKDEISEMRHASGLTLPILSSLYETVGSPVALQALLAGAVAGIVALGGWPAVSVYALTMAAWQGKEVFSEAVKSTLGKHR